MAPCIDMTGRVFGRLTVIKKSGTQDNPGRIMWDCKCDCGNKCRVRGDVLRRPDGKGTRSCGCIIANDLTGRRFGRIKVLGRAGRRGKRGETYLYKVQCDCGKAWTVTSCQLTSGDTKSCGCLSRENTSKRAFKHGASIAYRKYYQGAEPCTLEEVLKARWHSLRIRKKIVKNTEFCDWLIFRDWAMNLGFTRCSEVYRHDVTKPLSQKNGYLVTVERAEYVWEYKAFGYTASCKFWSEMVGISSTTIRAGMKYMGLDLEDAITRPLGTWKKENADVFYFRWEQNKIAVKLTVDKILAEEDEDKS